MAERIIDAKDMILGRVATYAAKMALNGDTINVVNCEKARITGQRHVVLEDQLHMRTRGNIRQGPYVFKNSDAYMRRVIRGMLPHKFDRGRKALSRVRCFVGMPEAFKTKPLESFEDCHIKKVRSAKSMALSEVSHAVGGSR